MTIAIEDGFGRHVYYLGTSNILQARKWVSIGTLTGFLDQCFSRASIIVFVMRMTPITLLWPRRVAYLAHSLNLIVVITAEIGFGMACVPFQGLWELSLDAKCYSPNVSTHLIYATGGEKESR